ncbi:MAG: ATP-binding protein, partial [Spirochaeta sp.]
MEVQAVLHKENPSSTRKCRVTGFDNSIVGARYPYYLSTVAQPFTEMGKAAVDLIEQKLAGKTPNSILLKTHMELRKSCGCYYVENSKAAEQEDIIFYQEQADIHRTLYKCSMSIHQAKTWDQLTTELNRCFSAFALNKAAVFLTPEYQRDLTSCSCEPLYVYDPKNPDPVVPQDLSIEEYLQRDSQVSWFVIPLQIGDTQLGYLCFEEISRFQHEYHLITSLVSSAVRILELHMIQVDYTRHLEERITSQIDKLRIEVTKRVHTEEQLRKTLYDRMRMEKEILTISEKEKRRIGQELHDDVCQRLVSISYIAGTLNQVSGDNAVKQVFDRIRCANEDVITQIKAICRGLFPIVLIEKGLSEALSDFAEYLDSCSGPCVHMIDKNTGEIPCVGNDVKLHLFRVAQEAAYNAFKHSSGTRITVSLEGTTNGVILQVQDNGTGFDPDDSSAGMGISTMRYRAALINAGLEISSGRHGTTVLCTLSRAIQSERPKWIE